MQTARCPLSRLTALSSRTSSIDTVSELSLCSHGCLHLSYAQYKEGRKKDHEAWLVRKKEREEKLARGEKVGPEEPDPTEEPEVGCLGLLKLIVITLVVVVLAGKFFTGSFLWEQELPNLRQYVPVSVFLCTLCLPPSCLRYRIL